MCNEDCEVAKGSTSKCVENLLKVYQWFPQISVNITSTIILLLISHISLSPCNVFHGNKVTFYFFFELCESPFSPEGSKHCIHVFPSASSCFEEEVGSISYSDHVRFSTSLLLRLTTFHMKGSLQILHCNVKT